jgi:tetratricopeptide (TPR) repeat protein
MSLLMDALKKAELAKRQGQDGIAGAAPATKSGLTLEPTPEATSSATKTTPPVGENALASDGLPPLPTYLEELDARFMAEVTRKKPGAAADVAPAPAADQPAAGKPWVSGSTERRRAPEADAASDLNKLAAQNLFAAKRPDQPLVRKSFALTVGTLTVLAAGAIVGYVWWQLQPKSSLASGAQPLAAQQRAPVPPAAPPLAVMPPQAPAAAVPPAPTIPAAPATPIVATTAPVVAPTIAVATPPLDEFAPPRLATPPRRERARAATPSEADGPVRVTRAPLQVNPALIRGFDAYNRGDLALAQIEYERARKSDPRNTDALHGLAAIAVREGRAEQAEWLYRQITEADPQDTVALAALINSRRQADPASAESRLKSLVATQPEIAAPHFALGNLYAQQARWNEAQQAYFRAYSVEADNPDILYNLAISLEHLRQNKLAAQYYALAIAAAQTRAAGFDKAQAAARLQTLQP